MQIHWIPAHVGVLGNEEADKAVKAAVKGIRIYSQKVYHLLVMCKQSLRRRVVKQWAGEWENGTSGWTTFLLQKKPNLKVLVKHNSIQCPLSSLITQLQTEKIGLAHYLHKI